MLLERITARLSEINGQEVMAPKQLRALSLRQQQAAIHHTRPADIYDEIAKVCPSQAGLKQLPYEEVNLRINSMGGPSPDHPPTYHKMPLSPESEEIELHEYKDDKLEGFFPISQPSIKDFLEDIEESHSIWASMGHQLELH